MVGVRGRIRFLFITLCLIVPSSVGAVPLAALGFSAALDVDALPSDALAAAHALALTGGPLGAAAAQALTFSAQAADPSSGIEDILIALEPLLAAHETAAGALAPGEAIHAGAPAALQEVRAILDALDKPRTQTDAERVTGLLATQARPEPRNLLPALPHFDSPSEAVHAHLAYYEHDATAAEHEAIAGLDALPARTGQALARIVAAHLFMTEATRVAFAGYEPSPEHLSTPIPLDALPFDVGLLMDARDRTVDIVLREAPLLEPLPRDCHPACALEICGVIFYNLTAGENLYTCDVPLSIDVGGDDIFAFNAGGTMAPDDTPVRPSGMHIARAGDDWYPCLRSGQGINGAAFQGSALLFDLGGDDRYEAIIAADGTLNGGALLGVGFFLDAEGLDHYWGSITDHGALNGGSYNGVGTMIDLAGNDNYADSGLDTVLSGIGAINGGAYGGRGFLADLGGDDVYGGRLAQGGVGGAGGHGGISVLIDQTGDDAHVTAIEGEGVLQGAGLMGGTGILLDQDGSDSYKGTITGRGAANGAALLGTGILIDAGTAVRDEFLDGFGTIHLVNGAAVGALADGDDTSHAAGALGLLIAAGGGDNEYIAQGVANGAGDLYGMGILIERTGSTSYLAAGPDALAFGAGRSGGIGIHTDSGGTDVISMGDGMGLARGAQGIGIVFRPEESSHANVADPWGPVETFTATGGGIAFWIDRGTFTVQARGPLSGCTHTPEIENQPVGAYTLYLCEPGQAGSQAIIHPGTGEPIGAVAKPPVPCSTTDIGDVNCGEAIGNTAGENWVTFLESDEVTSTLSGGTWGISWRPTAVPTGSGWFLQQFMVADRTCDPNCFM